MNDTITITKSAFDHRLKMAREEGYQAGLYDGITEAARNSQNITHDATPARFLQGKRIVATGDRDGFTAVSMADYPGYEVLSSVPVTERNQ